MWPHVAEADLPNEVFVGAINDCLHAVSAKGSPSFSAATEVTGDIHVGFLAWYDDHAGNPIYGVRLGRQNDVTICSGPSPMGPYVDKYQSEHRPQLLLLLGEHGLIELNVPTEGEYFANCRNTQPNLLLAIETDQTQKIGFKMISSQNVAETCRKFGS